MLQEYEKQMKSEIINDDELLQLNYFNVVYTGIIRPVNNVGNLLDCALLLKDYPNIRFLIYGDGSELKSLKERIKKDNLNNVRLKGFVEKKYIPYILSKSSVNILNYSQNQFNWSRGNSSNKLFEYMASGKPIISTVKMGYSIINKYNCGFEIEKCTAKDLADAILKIYHMSKIEYEKISQNAKIGAKDFDFNILTEKLINVIESVKNDKISY